MGRWPQKMGYPGRGTDALLGQRKVCILTNTEYEQVKTEAGRVKDYCWGFGSGCFTGMVAGGSVLMKRRSVTSLV